MLIAREDIFLQQDFKDKNQVFEFMAKHAVAQGWADDTGKIEADFWARENLYSTGFENQVAIPHAKTANVHRAGVIFIRLKDAMDWESLDEQPIKIIFGLLVPEEGAKILHLKIINALASQIVEDDFREALLTIADKEALFNFMKSRIDIEEQS